MRDLPFFPLYASTQLADRDFRLMGLDERGLWISILMECWPNLSVPAPPEDLAKYLGIDINQVKNALSERVKKQFKESNACYTSQELDDYRVAVQERRAAQSAGGKLGAAKKKSSASRTKVTPKGTKSESSEPDVINNYKRVQPSDIPVGEPEEVPLGEPVGPLNKVKSNSIKSNQLAGNRLVTENDSWIDEYAIASSVNDFSAFRS